MKVGAGTISLHSAEILIESRHQRMMRARYGKLPKLHCKMSASSPSGESLLRAGGITAWGCWGTIYVARDPLPPGDVLFSRRLYQSLEQGWAHVWAHSVLQWDNQSHCKVYPQYRYGQETQLGVGQEEQRAHHTRGQVKSMVRLQRQSRQAAHATPGAGANQGQKQEPE